MRGCAVVKERPILFNGAMVRAILEGRKTVTRRALNNQMANGWQIVDSKHPMATITSTHPKKGKFGLLIRREIYPDSGKFEHDVIVSPFGRPGDRLWGREAYSIDMIAAHSTDKGYDSEYELRYRADDASHAIHVAPGETDPFIALYDSQRGDWRPSIHMPRSASRILLEITELRVERLQDITEEQSMAEGVKPEPCDHARQACADIGCWGDTAKGAFGFLWESINGAGSWHANPWVWVVEFKRVEAANV